MQSTTQTPAPTPATTTTRGPDLSWLILTDYSSKYRVSISTLRRRIKHGEIPHRVENGRYLLPDAEKLDDLIAETTAGFAPNRALTELKKTFGGILQEKEAQILRLRGEISDLKTLIRVLEDDNARLRGGR